MFSHSQHTHCRHSLCNSLYFPIKLSTLLKEKKRIYSNHVTS
jgi:hypothetical protein